MSSDKRMTLRLPESLGKWVVDTAKKEGRSNNAQIVESLKEFRAMKLEEKLQEKML